MIMKMKTTNHDVGRLPYEAPQMTAMSVKSEGVLCRSDESLYDETPYLQDYNPSNGAW